MHERHQQAILRRSPVSVRAILLAVLLAPVGFFSASASPRIVGFDQLTFRVYNYAQVEAKVLDDAMEEARWIFQHAGIPSSWVRCRTENDTAAVPYCPVTTKPTVLSMRVLRRPIPLGRSGERSVFGFAFPAGADGFSKMAAVFWSRINSVRRANKSQLLAAVLAHEAGHLLLGENSHYPVGVMKEIVSRADLYRMAQHTPRFWKKQESVLQRAVAQRFSAEWQGYPENQIAQSFSPAEEKQLN